jgi:hypothetical protein
MLPLLRMNSKPGIWHGEKCRWSKRIVLIWKHG